MNDLNLTPKDTKLYKEIHEQPEVIARFLQTEEQTIAQLAKAIKQRDIVHVVIAARGTSDNVGRYAQYVLGAQNGLVVALATPSLYSIYKKPPRFGNSLVLGISQSGKSPDIVSVLEEAKRQGALTAVITNHPASALAQYGDYVIDLHAGEEKAVAATKTYTGELAAISMLSVLLAESAEMQSALEEIPEAVSKTLALNDVISGIAPRYRYMQNCVAISRGYNYATAYEFALKLKELTYINVDAYSSADFLHGPIAILEPGYPVILIAPNGAMLPKMHSFVQALIERQAEVVVISDEKDLLSSARIPLELPYSVPEWLSVIPAIIPGQLFALHLAHVCGYDVDAPRGLNKVTETY